MPDAVEKLFIYYRYTFVNAFSYLYQCAHPKLLYGIYKFIKFRTPKKVHNVKKSPNVAIF